MKKIVFIISIFISLNLYSQKNDALEICFQLQNSAKGFITNNEAERALDRILSIIGASKNFTLQPCDKINNAVAITWKGNRYILYDKQLMQKINSATNNWSAIFILAHEVGHHINGHTRDAALGRTLERETLEQSRMDELEADQFAGFILAKLGASLNQTTAGISLISSNSDDIYSTHPNRNKRLEAVRKGYNSGRPKSNKPSASTNSTSSKVEINEKDSKWFKDNQILNPDDPFNKKTKTIVYSFGEVKPLSPKNNENPKFTISVDENSNERSWDKKINYAVISTISDIRIKSNPVEDFISHSFDYHNVWGSYGVMDWVDMKEYRQTLKKIAEDFVESYEGRKYLLNEALKSINYCASNNHYITKGYIAETNEWLDRSNDYGSYKTYSGKTCNCPIGFIDAPLGEFISEQVPERKFKFAFTSNTKTYLSSSITDSISITPYKVGGGKLPSDPHNWSPISNSNFTYLLFRYNKGKYLKSFYSSTKKGESEKVFFKIPKQELKFVVGVPLYLSDSIVKSAYKNRFISYNSFIYKRKNLSDADMWGSTRSQSDKEKIWKKDEEQFNSRTFDINFYLTFSRTIEDSGKYYEFDLYGAGNKVDNAGFPK